jgi:acetate kinase
MLERRSGLLGMSGSAKTYATAARGERQPAARLALDVLGWRLRASLGAMAAVLGGVDLIVFTGGIGEHAVSIRSAALDGGLGLGAQLNEQRNAKATEGRIESDTSTVAVCVVTAREGWQLARAALSALA